MEQPNEEENIRIIEHGNWKLVWRDEVPDHANNLDERLELAIKDSGTGHEVWKARFFVQCHRDKMKEFPVLDTSTFRQHSTRILIGLATIFCFKMFSTDVTQTYLQKMVKSYFEIFTLNRQRNLGLVLTQCLRS